MNFLDFIPKKQTELIFNKILSYFKNLSRIRKALLLISIVVFASLIARAHLLGDTLFLLTKNVLSVHVHGIDCKESEAYVPVSITFDVQKNGVFIPGFRGNSYYSGDTITINISHENDCYISIFGIDKMGPYGLLNGSLEPYFYKGSDKSYSISLTLDTTTGEEVFYVVANHEVFSFNRDLKPALEKVYNLDDQKGVNFSSLFLDLNKKYFFQNFTYFNHE